jgi:choline dehydrogenase-like flavoprotein
VGRVRGARRAVVGYDLTRADGAKLTRAVWAMGRVLFAAGAREVLTGIPRHERVRTEADLADAVAHADPRHLHLAAFHPTGTARLGADAQAAPVDPEGRLRGAEGLWVADASVVPTCPQVNPQVAIMALALSIASHLVAARAS